MAVSRCENLMEYLINIEVSFQEIASIIHSVSGKGAKYTTNLKLLLLFFHSSRMNFTMVPSGILTHCFVLFRCLWYNRTATFETSQGQVNYRRQTQRIRKYRDIQPSQTYIPSLRSTAKRLLPTQSEGSSPQYIV